MLRRGSPNRQPWKEVSTGSWRSIETWTSEKGSMRVRVMDDQLGQEMLTGWLAGLGFGCKSKAESDGSREDVEILNDFH